jgi:hypothetical protein
VNALELAPREMTQTDGYWLGRLSMVLACEMPSSKVAREALYEFLRSPVPTPELKRMLREEMTR